MDELLGVLHAVYFVVLLHGFLIGLLFTFCGVIVWAIDERPLRLGWFAVCLPVRGRWVRYLLAPVLLVIAFALLGVVSGVLVVLPPVVGLPLLVGAVSVAISRIPSSRNSTAPPTQ